MGESDVTDFFLRLVVIALFAVMLVYGLLVLTEFKATIKTVSVQRLGIDFGENVLSSACTADLKGLLNETKLNAEKASYDSEKNGMSGFSCINTSFRARTLVKTSDAGKMWDFGYEEGGKNRNMFEFPSALNSSDGSIIPAVVSVAVEASVECNAGNSGKNCYNCLEESECKSMGCSWSPAKPTTGPGFCTP